ncbi:uncharacterized protein NPIL_322771 [Nephila pilipes]|uniref:Uncharacterized protein n=1 Tax=Nephila pilipes TaxID=299642 RepID=A0A8X6UJT9_NEPPI|nr:uncharacterized protein NPIL_322771 [Nephila pilipes]
MNNRKYYESTEDDEFLCEDAFAYKDQKKYLQRKSPSPSKFPKCFDPKLVDKRPWLMGGDSNKLVRSKSPDFSVKYIESPPKKRWTVSYDNRNYIKSQLSEDVLDHLLEKKKRNNAIVNRSWKRTET